MKQRGDLLRLIETIQMYENLIESILSEITLYYPDIDGPKAIEKYKQYLVKSALNEAEGNRKKAAKLLNMPRQTLYYILKRVKNESKSS